MSTFPQGHVGPGGADSPGNAGSRLTSWKEIASHFQRDIRTVQHWEIKEGLPVHRHEHRLRASVYAYPAELDAWFRERARKRIPEENLPAPGNTTPLSREANARSLLALSAPARLLLLLLMAILAGTGWFVWRSVRSTRLPGNGSLAILPFLNLTGDSEQDYLSDGLTDELTTLFASQLRLLVVARTSAFEFKGKPDDIRIVGKQLNAAMVLEGSLAARGDQLRINAQLIRTSDGYHLWSHIYDSSRADTPATEELIVRDIAQALKLALPASAAANSAGTDEQAHTFYLQGQYWWNRRSPSDEWKAIEFFNQAIDRQPLYARAYLGLAQAYAVLGINDQAPPDEVIPKAREAAEKALQIDPELGEAHAVLAHIQSSYDWNNSAAESEFLKAISSDPGYAPGRHWYGLMLMYQGRFDEAGQEFEQAQQLDPLSPIFPALRSRLLLYSGKFDAAARQGQDASRGNPNFPIPHLALGQVYLYQGKYSDALDEFQKYYELSNHDPDTLTNQAMVYAHMGNRSKAMELLRQIKDQKTGYSSPYNDAQIYAALGNKELAFASLDRAISARSPALIQLLVDPAFSSMRSEARFQQMLRRTGHLT
jgi:TolB-like protein/Flp pilus assembly protein TadD